MGKDQTALIREILEDRSEVSVNDTCSTSTEAVVVVTCSMCMRNPNSLTPTLDQPRKQISIKTLANQVWVKCNGDTVLNRELERLTDEYNVGAVLVVGHTDCDVVSRSCDRCFGRNTEVPPGIEVYLDPLVSLVKRAFEEGIVDSSTHMNKTKHRIVEYNVGRQVEFLEQKLPVSTTVSGYIFDQDGVYGSRVDEHYKVTGTETEITGVQDILTQDKP
ncbi:MAG: carbonic anhydrase [Halobacteria archaeon]